MAPQKWIFGNWKMAQSLATAQDFFKGWKVSVSTVREIVIFPSYPHLPAALESVKSLKLPLKVGAQDCSTEERGAFTGEVSAQTLAEIGAAYVLIGHSERRRRGPETDESLAKKIRNVFAAGLKPVYCLGETEAERDSGRLLEVLKHQSSLVAVESKDMIVAYEPVWAIGTGKVASISDIEYAHKSLRDLLPKNTPILYGGSVNAQNASSILSVANVDGLLVGGASLKADEFSRIATANL